MKLIDEKGRIFGKLNIIDLLIVLVVLGGIAGVFYKFGYLQKLSTTQENNQKYLVQIMVKGVAQYSANAIEESKGGILKELRSNADIGEIKNVEVRQSTDDVETADGRVIVAEVPDKFDAFITIKTLSGFPEGNVRLGSKDAKVGVGIDLKGPNFQTTGYVIKVDKDVQ